jgi:hypothetical protein
MTDAPTPISLERLRSALARLSWSASEQREYLLGLGVGLADELALEFDDALRPIRHALFNLDLPAGVQASIVAIDRKFEEMSGSRNGSDLLWELDALDQVGQWDELRTLAQTAIAEWDDI